MSSSRDSEEEISSHTSEVAKNTNKRINEALDISNHGNKRARKEVETDNKSTNVFENAQFSKIVKLNVGGHFFSTSLETLTNDSDSMLHAMFSGRFDTKPCEDGSYFIDRDGTHFRYILNYLRTGQLIVPEDVIVRREILAEAEFYQIEGIINELTARPFKLDSIVIVPSDQRQTLLNWLKGTQALTTGSSLPVLLYRASRDGWTGDKFHSFCDKKRPTVVVIKGGSYIFGGYTEEDWDNASGVMMKTQDSFLFNFEDPSDGQIKHIGGLFSPVQQTPVADVSRHEPLFKDGCDSVSVNAPIDSNNCSVSLNGRKYMIEDQFPSFINVGLFGQRRLGPSASGILREIEVFGFGK